MTASVLQLRPSHWCVARDLSDLASIVEPSITLVILERSVSAEVDTATRKLLELPDFREITLVDVPGRRFRHQLTRLLPDVASRAALVEDLDLLAATFFLLARPRAVGLRLQRTKHGPPASFSALREPAMLVSGYGANGMEWLPNGAARRHRLHRAALAPSFDPTHISPLPPYAVGLLKGEYWSGNQGNGIVYRRSTHPPSGPGLILSLLSC